MLELADWTTDSGRNPRGAVLLMGRFQTSLRLLAAASIGLILAALATEDAAAQPPPPNQTPTLEASVVNSYLSAPGAVFDLTSKFLRDNASAAASSSKNGSTLNALGGGADLASSGAAETTARPSYRFWMEGYGLRSKTGAQGTFTGDERKSFMSTCLKGENAAPATQQEKMKSCNADASKKSLKGDERKAFMSSCLRA